MFRVLGHTVAYMKYACDVPSGLYRTVLCLRHHNLNSTNNTLRGTQNFVIIFYFVYLFTKLVVFFIKAVCSLRYIFLLNQQMRTQNKPSYSYFNTATFR